MHFEFGTVVSGRKGGVADLFSLLDIPCSCNHDLPNQPHLDP
jgi:hypothetical protein